MGKNRRTPSGLSMPLAQDEDYNYRRGDSEIRCFLRFPFVFGYLSPFFPPFSWLGFPFDSGADGMGILLLRFIYPFMA